MSNFNSVIISFVKYGFAFMCFCNFHVDGDRKNLKFYEEKNFHLPRMLTRYEMTNVSSYSDGSRFEGILSNIMIPRVVGTAEHEQVKDYIVNFLQTLDWNVELHEFEQFIPLFNKKLKFSNVIARLNKDASRYLVLACHYDSKYMKEFKFYGATDSAVPCAMMLDIAASLNDVLRRYRSSDLSLMLLFFDGEEAFVRWSPNDSIYGARYLANSWTHTSYSKDGANELQRMDLMVLLDLLGASNPNVPIFTLDTAGLYHVLANIENKLSDLGQLEDYSKRKKYFVNRRSYSLVEDDHIPFMNANTPVPILHIIPEPFPAVWHTRGDDYSALDFPTINNLNKIFRIFTLSYLGGGFDEEKYSRMMNRL